MIDTCIHHLLLSDSYGEKAFESYLKHPNDTVEYQYPEATKKEDHAVTSWLHLGLKL